MLVLLWPCNYYTKENGPQAVMAPARYFTLSHSVRAKLKEGLKCLSLGFSRVRSHEFLHSPDLSLVVRLLVRHVLRVFLLGHVVTKSLTNLTHNYQPVPGGKVENVKLT